MIRPWYRSRLFWLGIPGLVFLLWAWKDSNHRSWLFRRCAPTSDTVFFHWRGGVAVSRAILADKASSLSFSVGDRKFVVYRTKDGIPTGRSSAPSWRFIRFAPQNPARAGLDRRSFEDGSTAWSAFLPYRLIIPSYLALWISALALWQRRKARLSRRAAMAGS